MQRTLFLAYGIGCHAMFLAVYAYFAAFVGNFPFVPKTINSGPVDPWYVALAVNVGLVGLFGLQHSIMARPAFKRWWTRFVPQPIERSTYVLISNLLVVLLIWQWRPMPAEIWNLSSGAGYVVMMSLFATGWLLVPAVSLMINHFDLFGTRQVWLHFQGKPYTPLAFRAPLAYRFVRHPLYIGWMLAFWAIPVMSVGHLLFAATLSVYMIAATFVEERDLAAHFGRQYVDYQRMVGRFLPRVGSAGGELQPAPVEVKAS